MMEKKNQTKRMNFVQKVLPVLLLIFIAGAGDVNGQDDLDKYFEDGGLLGNRMAIKVGADPIEREYFATFEHKLFRTVTFRYFVSMIDYKGTHWRYGFEPLPNVPEEGFGHALGLSIKRHTLGTLFDRGFLSTGFRRTMLGEQVYWDFQFVGIGTHRQIYRRFMLELNAGVGMRFFREDRGLWYDDDLDVRFYLPFQLGLGFSF